MKANDYIKHLIEEARHLDEVYTLPDPAPVPVTVKIDRIELEAAQALAERFGKSRHEILVMLLTGAIEEAVATYNAEIQEGEWPPIPMPENHLLDVNEEEAA